MALEITEVAGTQTVGGQPVTAEAGSTEVVVEEVVSETVVEGGTVATSETSAETVKPAEVNIAPEALRQITALSAANRRMKAQIAELTGKVTPADVAEKLSRLAALENETPRQYLKRTGKTLEDVAADTIGDDEPRDSRLDAVLPEIEALKKKLADKEVDEGKQAEDRIKAEQATREENARAYVKDIVSSKPERWTLIAADPNIGPEIVKAAMLVAKRDHTDKATGKVKQLDQKTTDAILEECLDHAETFALAAKMMEDKKNGVAKPESLVKKRGLEVLDSAEYARRAGDDGKGVDGQHTPKVTIDGNRSAIRRDVVKRGPTDVRTARARALRMVGAGKDELK